MTLLHFFVLVRSSVQKRVMLASLSVLNCFRNINQNFPTSKSQAFELLTLKMLFWKSDRTELLFLLELSVWPTMTCSNKCRNSLNGYFLFISSLNCLIWLEVPGLIVHCKKCSEGKTTRFFCVNFDFPQLCVSKDNFWFFHVFFGEIAIKS